MLEVAALVLTLIFAFGSGYNLAMSRTYRACAEYWRHLSNTTLWEKRDPTLYDHVHAFHRAFDPLRSRRHRRLLQGDHDGPKGDTNGG